MIVLGTLGILLVILAGAALLAERRTAARERRRLRLPYVVTDMVGGLFGLVVAVIAFTAGP